MAASEGVDLEWRIVTLLGGKDPMKRKYSSKIEQQGKQCAEKIIAFMGKNNRIEVWHSDDPTNPLKRAIYAKPEPKTDIIIRCKNKIYLTSVKMAGPIQLSSGQGSSSADLFEAAAKSLKINGKDIQNLIKELRNMPTRLLAESNLPRIKKEASPQVISEFIKNSKIMPAKNYDIWIENNKPLLMESMIKFIEKNQNFKIELVREALTGELSLKQFRGAAADSIISPKGFYIINNQYINTIIRNIKIDIRGKSRKGITGIALRIETK